MESLPKHHLLEFRPDTLEAVRKLYNLDDPKDLAGAIDVLETWMKQQNHFLKKDYDRAYLEKTLIACKGSIQKTKSQIDKLCTMKTLLPNFFKECNVKEDFKNLFDVISIVPLPKPTKDYYRVFMSRASNKPIQASDIFDFYRLTFVIYEYLKVHDYCNGYIGIHDFREINIMDMLNNVNLVEMQHYFRIFIDGYGARLKGLHIMSNSKVIDLLVKTLKQFVSAKIGNRIYVHSSNEDILKVISKDMLPLEYGGEQKPMQELHREWTEELSSKKFREHLKMVFEARTDEKYRQTDKFNADYMGMPGSFRSLNVD